MKAKRLLFLVMAICLASGIKAQISNTGVLFFHWVENTTTGLQRPITDPHATIKIMRIKKGILEVYGGEVKEVISNLKINPLYYDNVSYRVVSHWVQHTTNLKYDYDMSSPKWYVWSDGYRIMDDEYRFYFALKKDFSEYTEWREPDDGGAGRSIYKGYTKEQLLKIELGGKRDFLN